MKSAIRDIGWLIALDAGLTGSVSTVGRLLIGVLGGLPAEAIAVSGAVAFTASALLELPTGILSDMFGRVRSVTAGYTCQALASTSLFGAFAVFPAHPELMWAFLVLEALFDAVGVACVSGSREAIFQEILLKETKHLPEDERKRVEASGQMMAERYGRVFAFMTPIIGLAVAVSAQAQAGRGHWLLLAHAAAWLFIVSRTFALARRFNVADATGHSWREDVARWRTSMRELGRRVRDAADVRYAAVIGSVGTFLSGIVEAFFVVMILRDQEMFAGLPFWAPALALTAMVATGHLIRSLLLPALVEKHRNDRLIAAGLAGLVVLSGAMLALLQMDLHTLKLVPMLLFIPAYHVLVGMVVRPSLGLLLAGTPAEVHATAVSLRSACALLLLGAYSLALSFVAGTPAPPMMFATLLACFAFLLLLALTRFVKRTS